MENLTSEDFETFEEYEDYLSKKPSAPAKKVGGSAILNIKVVNATGVAQTMELFNPNASIALTGNLQVTTLTPFTIADVASVLVNNTAPTPDFPLNKVAFNEFGNLQYQSLAGGVDQVMTISCTNNGVTYRQIFESCKTMRFRIYKCLYSFVADPQADNGINFFYKSTFGKQSNNEITPSAFKDPINPQTKLLNVQANWLIDCESGLTQTINIGETVSMQLYIDNIDRGSQVWAKR